MRSRLLSKVVVLFGERPSSWNDWYSGKHWSARRREAQRCHALVRSALDPDDRPFDQPVVVHVIVYFKDQPLDSCNIPAKLYIDGLLARGDWQDGARSLLWDDDMRYVVSTTTIPRLDQENPRVEIVLVVADESS